jgi:hypothetical protein
VTAGQQPPQQDNSQHKADRQAHHASQENRHRFMAGKPQPAGNGRSQQHDRRTPEPRKSFPPATARRLIVKPARYAISNHDRLRGLRKRINETGR